MRGGAANLPLTTAISIPGNTPIKPYFPFIETGIVEERLIRLDENLPPRLVSGACRNSVGSITGPSRRFRQCLLRKNLNRVSSARKSGPKPLQLRSRS